MFGSLKAVLVIVMLVTSVANGGVIYSVLDAGSPVGGTHIAVGTNQFLLMSFDLTSDAATVVVARVNIDGLGPVSMLSGFTLSIGDTIFGSASSLPASMATTSIFHSGQVVRYDLRANYTGPYGPTDTVVTPELVSVTGSSVTLSPLYGNQIILDGLGSPTPEPSSFLSLLGALFLSLFRRRRRV